LFIIGYLSFGIRLFLVPKPRLGNASAPEAPASGRLPGSQGFPGKCVPKQGLGNEKNQTSEVSEALIIKWLTKERMIYYIFL
jgi:hypothetical protein